MDLRVKKTYKALVEALMELMEERPFEEITVAALCDRAMIRRTTFYKHFTDKYEVLDFALQSLWDELMGEVGHPSDARSPHGYGLEFMQQCREFVSAHEKLMDNIILDGMYGTVVNVMRDVLTRNLTAGFREERKKGAQLLAEPEVEASFMAGGIMEILRCWWVSGRSESVVDGARQIFEALLRESGIAIEPATKPAVDGGEGRANPSRPL